MRHKSHVVRNCDVSTCIRIKVLVFNESVLHNVASYVTSLLYVTSEDGGVFYKLVLDQANRKKTPMELFFRERIKSKNAR